MDVLPAVFKLSQGTGGHQDACRNTGYHDMFLHASWCPHAHMQQLLFKDVLLVVCWRQNTLQGAHQPALAENTCCGMCLVSVPAHIDGHVVYYVQAKRTNSR